MSPLSYEDTVSTQTLTTLKDRQRPFPHALTPLSFPVLRQTTSQAEKNVKINHETYYEIKIRGPSVKKQPLKSMDDILVWK
jgi:hypothetical protein